MKKFGSMVLSVVLAASLAGCGASGTASASASAAGTSSGKVYKVAVVKQLQHASLDEIANAITAELDAIAEKEGVTIEYGDVYDGQNDQSQLTTIGSQVVNDNVDCIIPIATLAAQTMAAAAQDSGTPVVFAAISDPESADLTGFDNVTGTSDALDTERILDMMLAQNPDVKTVGLLYSTSETNSQKPIAEAKAYLDKKGISYVEATGNTTDEIQTAVSNLVSQKVDAVFTPTDNVVASAELSIADTLAEAKIPHYAGADSFVRNGAFATCGVNYTELGKKTADLAYQVMSQGFDSLGDDTIDGAQKTDNYYVIKGTVVTVNSETAEKGGFDDSSFSQFGDVTEVSTTEE